jgi:hypothetical protein
MNVYIIYIQMYFLNIFMKLLELLIIKLNTKIIDALTEFIEIFIDLKFYLEEKKEIKTYSFSESSGEDYESDDSSVSEYKFINKEIRINLNRLNIGKYKCKDKLVLNKVKYNLLKLKCAFTFDVDRTNKSDVLMLKSNIKSKLILWSNIHNNININSVLKLSNQKGRYLFLLIEDSNYFNSNLIVDLYDKKNIITGESLSFSKICL